MAKLGQFNELQILENTPDGVCFDDGRDGEIWLLQGEVLDKEVGEWQEVFVLNGADDKLLASLNEPYAYLGEFACLEVVSIQNIGAFLDWGLGKNLFLPYREQTRDLREGDYVCVFLYLDNMNRISASMRIEKFVEKNPNEYEEGDSVDLFITQKTDLGFKAVINERHLGFLFKEDVFQTLYPGQRIRGFIKKLRDDGKIDLSLQQSGYKDCDDISELILTLLKERDGYLPIGDKSSAEAIYDLVGVSKKKYKMAVGKLYKEKLIDIDGSATGIRLRS